MQQKRIKNVALQIMTNLLSAFEGCLAGIHVYLFKMLAVESDIRKRRCA